MKRCPECYEVYENNDKFCEVDGEPLLADPALPPPDAASAKAFAESETAHAAEVYVNESERRLEVWMVGAAGVVLGVVICVGVYAAFNVWSDNSDSKDPKGPAFTSRAREPIQSSRPPPPRSETTPEPQETETIEPEESTEPQPAPAEENSVVAARLNQGPVSTGQRKKDNDDSVGVQTTIQMNDGTTVEVDAAWEDGQGVWYRRGGMVAFVDSQRVKAIIGRAVPKPIAVSSR
jgi:cytoskeletal protein RodZ